MNYEKVQKYLKSLQNAGVTNCDLNGYQNYINNAKLHRQSQRQMMNTLPNPHHHHTPVHAPNHYHHMPIYAPPSGASSGYLQNARMYTLPHSYQSNYYQDYYSTQDERKSPRDVERKERKPRKPVVEDANLSYTGVDRDLADSYLKTIESNSNHHHM
jgi:hypothetical protein